LVTTTFNIILGGVCLALALAFGLGGKDAAARYLEELKEKRSQKKTGEKSSCLGNDKLFRVGIQNKAICAEH
jgi:hypothetical protein